MRRFKFGGFGGGGNDDGQSSSEGSPAADAAPPSSSEQAPAAPAADSAPAPEAPAAEGSDAQEPSRKPGAESWMPPGGEPFAGEPDKPAPIGGFASSSGSGSGSGSDSGSGSSDASSPWTPAASSAGAAAAGAAAASESTSGESSASGSGDSSHEADTGEHQVAEGSDKSGDEPGFRDVKLPDAPERTDEQKATAESMRSRVSVVDEQPRPAPPDGASDEEYKWHTYKHYPSGRPDAVEFIDTYKAFGRNRILRGLNMGLPEGMVSMILGPSGTGKSVCIKHMVGLLYPDEGDILVHGESVPNMPDDDLFEMRKKFGLLFQDGALFGSMDLYDNTAFPLRQHTEKSEDEIEDIVMRRLNEVGLGSAREKYPNELSGGMRKRAGFARALVLEPDILLFDEPDSGLDPVRTALLGELILEIHRDMMDEAKEKQRTHLPTFAVITHDIMSARRVADYINVLWKGRIVEAGPAEDMLNSDNPFIRQFLAGESQGPLTMD
jgi:phospholipid/cholesterol/gamma-HCH transport system ATP-binding protein